ncbi:Na+/H+ antiporter subunit E [Neogemmobacter tilapiae]|uniref:Cation:proton antiporter n=1 Tax=Neogemmobacter tilapiae TaxID=875041 RepID=A0A918TWR6_9RHOB|nr:Na+/H+ antiporter subunit E [Gemmobacter tilapiae]GHC60135.1 cation:proton antiporter [Gemmobacter tilapiae]
MRHALPHPLLSLALTLMWLLLTRFSLGQLILGAAMGLFAGWVFARLEPTAPRIRAYRPLFRLMGIVTLDILRSNAAVAWLILTNDRHGNRRSGFVEVSLRLKDPTALALLAIIITATPGTAWLEYDEPSGTLLLHVFDMVDESAWQALIRDRYEQLLLEAFA